MFIIIIVPHAPQHIYDISIHISMCTDAPRMRIVIIFVSSSAVYGVQRFGMGMERNGGEGGEREALRGGVVLWNPYKQYNPDPILPLYTTDVLQNNGARSKWASQWRYKEVLSTSVYMTRGTYIPTSYRSAIQEGVLCKGFPGFNRILVPI
jgi:hypothetical protein